MSTSGPAQPSPTILLFARGLLAILDLWPALTIAVREQWGGHDSLAKKTYLASAIIDEFESRARYLPSPHPATSSSSSSSSSGPLQVDPATASDPPLDTDDLIDMLSQYMGDEFDASIEDGSIDSVASDIVRLWRDLLVPRLEGGGPMPEGVVEALEKQAVDVKRKGVNAQSGGGPVDVDVNAGGLADDDFVTDSEDGDSDGAGMDVDEEAAPQLVESKPKERKEEVVDEDGFTLVQGKGKKGR